MTNGQFYYVDAERRAEGRHLLRHLREDQRQPADRQVHRQQRRQVVRRHARRRGRHAARLGRAQRQPEHDHRRQGQDRRGHRRCPRTPRARSTSTTLLDRPEPGQGDPGDQRRQQDADARLHQAVRRLAVRHGPDLDLPAHVVGEKALGITDPTGGQGRRRQGDPGQGRGRPGRRSPTFWNTGFDFTTLPTDKDAVRSPTAPTSSRTSRRTVRHARRRTRSTRVTTSRHVRHRDGPLERGPDGAGPGRCRTVRSTCSPRRSPPTSSRRPRRSRTSTIKKGVRGHLRAHGPRPEQQGPVRPGDLRRRRRRRRCSSARRSCTACRARRSSTS